MQILTIELTGSDSLKALEELENKHLIRIVKQPDLNSYAFPGERLSEEDFKEWVEYAGESPAINISEAKQQWAIQKKKLQKRIR